MCLDMLMRMTWHNTTKNQVDKAARQVVIGGLAVHQDGIVFPREMPLSAAAGFVLPDNFVLKIFRPEHLIHDQLHIVGGVPIQVHPNQSVLCQQLPHED